MIPKLLNKINQKFSYFRFFQYLQLYRTRKNYKRHKNNIFNKFDEKSSFIIHIPKTAGTSVTKSIYGTDSNCCHYEWKYLKIILKQNFYNYFSFSIVRNPWDRCLSAYEFLRMGGDNNKDRIFYQKYMSNYNDFEDFVKNGLFKKRIFSSTHFLPQSNFIFSKNDKCMVNYLLRFETIESDYKFIKKKLGGSNLLKYKINRTNHDYNKHYDKEMENIVYRLYKRDIILLKYSF
tara:strand:+ start:1354 stop:2052 length:699 start_codon:yes stop_codon:yes gene_type:complete